EAALDAGQERERRGERLDVGGVEGAEHAAGRAAGGEQLGERLGDGAHAEERAQADQAGERRAGEGEVARTDAARGEVAAGARRAERSVEADGAEAAVEAMARVGRAHLDVEPHRHAQGGGGAGGGGGEVARALLPGAHRLDVAVHAAYHGTR